MTIVALTGLAGAGKDSVADILVDQWHFTKIAFADALRAELAHAFSCPITLFTERAGKEIPTKALSLDNCRDDRFVRLVISQESTDDIDAPDDVPTMLRQPRSPRRMMQLWGTEYRRKLFGVDYWIVELAERLAAINGPIVIADCREPHEAKYISSIGGEIWRVNRDSITPVASHSSESQLPDHWIDRDIDNNADLDLLQIETRCAMAAATRAMRNDLAA